MKTEYPFFRQVINPLSMLNNSSGQRLFSEDTLNELNKEFNEIYGQMHEGEFTEDLKQQLNNALEGLARGNQNAAQALFLETKDKRLIRFLIKAKNILMPAKGGLRKTRRLAKRKTLGRGRRLAKKTRRS